jgi:hypothetical protein
MESRVLDLADSLIACSFEKALNVPIASQDENARDDDACNTCDA